MGQTGATNFTLSGKLRIMQRKEWLAQPLAAPLPILTTPVPYVIISHTATEQCLKIAECILQVRTVQTFHIESRGWWDIGYNFLVGGDGFAYTGRGWDTIGAHAYGYNNVSIGISFIGTFNTVLPPARQLTAAKQLIELGVKLGKISENYKLLGHKQVSATESPARKNVLHNTVYVNIHSFEKKIENTIVFLPQGRLNESLFIVIGFMTVISFYFFIFFSIHPLAILYGRQMSPKIRKNDLHYLHNFMRLELPGSGDLLP
ncbi:uncharacterized protein GBIM_12823, partial [Gryllus bimaculatus]